MTGVIAPTAKFGPGETDVLLANAGGNNPRPFATGGLAMNRGVNQHGQLGFDLAYRDTIGYVGQPDRLRGKWVSWTHRTLGPWTGMVIDVRPDPDAGIIDCTAFGFSWRFRRRVTPKFSRPIAGPPGSIITSVITSAATDDPLPIEGIDAEEVGDPITYQARGQTIDDVISSVTAQTGQEWYVDPTTRRLQWRAQYGRDRSGSVQLVDGVHITGYDPTFTLDGLTNALFVMPADARYQAARAFWVERPESIDAYGRLEDTQTYVNAVTRSSIGPIARADLLKRSRLGRALQLTVVDTDGCFGWFGPGDTITVLLSRISTTYRMRVMVQSFEADTRTMTISGYVP
jgi:hypothetical protein